MNAYCILIVCRIYAARTKPLTSSYTRGRCSCRERLKLKCGMFCLVGCSTAQKEGGKSSFASWKPVPGAIIAIWFAHKWSGKNAAHFFHSAVLQKYRVEVCIQNWEFAYWVQTRVSSSWWPLLPLRVFVDMCPIGSAIITVCSLVSDWKEVTGWDKGGTLFSNKTWNPLCLLLLCKTGNCTTEDSVCKHTQLGMQFSFQEYTMDDV